MARQVLVLDPATRELAAHPPDSLPPPPSGGPVVWIDLTDPTAKELEEVGRLYGLHHLALEDCLHDDQRPKLEPYENHVFMVLHNPSYDRQRHKIRLEELDMFLGQSFVVTSHPKPLPALDIVRERWGEAEEANAEGAAFLAYLIADTLVDDYFPVLDALEDRLAELDERVFREPDGDLLEIAFRLKKQLLLMRRIVGPTRDSFMWLLRREAPLINRTAAFHFQDVYDHLIRISDTLDLYRDLAGGVQETYLSMVANRTNNSMKKLTAFTITLMCVTLVSGIYGMNFQFMPELAWRMGYRWALAAMATVATVCLLVFRLRGYF